MLTRSSWMVLRAIGSQSQTISQIAKTYGKSLSWTSEIIHNLRNEGFVSIERHGNTHYVSSEITEHARAAQALIIEVPGLDYEKFLVGERLRVLGSIVREAKNVGEIAFALQMREKMVRFYLHELRNRALVMRENGYYRISKYRLTLVKFVEAYRNYTSVRGRLLWKLDNEILFQTYEVVDATPTGFTAYPDLGIMMYGINYTFFLQKRKLSVDEVAVHSLIELSDPRDLALVISFFLKHRLTYKRLELLATRYDCRERLRDLFIVMKSQDRRIVTERLPAITRNELNETLKMYGVM